VGVLAEDEVEALGEEGLQHEVDVVGRGAAGGVGGDVETVGVEPGGAGEDVVRVDAIGEGDHVDHGGVVQDVAVAAEGASGEVGSEGVSADVDVGEIEGGGGLRGGGRGGLGERGCEEEGEEGGAGESSVEGGHVLRRLYVQRWILERGSWPM
jgi:hypothetical protein